MSPGMHAAMNLWHGEISAAEIKELKRVIAILGLHDVGIPWMILTRGRTRNPYSFHTIVVFGVNTNAV
jgi:hypothetical protein